MDKILNFPDINKNFLSYLTNKDINNLMLSGNIGSFGIDAKNEMKIRKIQKEYENYLSKIIVKKILDLVEFDEHDIHVMNNIKNIPDDFLRYNCNITSIKLLHFTNVESVGNNFLEGCKNLTSVNLSSLKELKSIGNNFLSGCISLNSIDLSNLSNLNSIGDLFLYGCKSLKTIDLRYLSSLKSLDIHKDLDLKIKLTPFQYYKIYKPVVMFGKNDNRVDIDEEKREI